MIGVGTRGTKLLSILSGLLSWAVTLKQGHWYFSDTSSDAHSDTIADTDTSDNDIEAVPSDSYMVILLLKILKLVEEMLLLIVH